MIKLIRMCKMFILSMIVALMILPKTNCQAYKESVPVTSTRIKDIVGNWYDSKGNLVMKISNDYTINGCKIVAAYSTNENNLYFYEANECYRIIEKNGYRDINFEHYFGKNGNHEMLIVNGKNTLRRTKKPHYFESIGGIYLEMDKESVLSLYGQPTSISWKGNMWIYSKEGFDVKFAGNVVHQIKIYTSGNRHFDKTGLSARDSKEIFRQKYNAKNGYNQRYGVTDRILDLGYGESIYFDNYPNYITLEVSEVL